jgi:tRNA uridine 5-carboxymethylaminomethyl modification enzyme
MSCNPAIGGIAKGTVVREVDALGGIMGRATDLARIQFRMLNRSKGPAVWSPRAQCDRSLYRRAVRGLLDRRPNLELAHGTVAGLTVEGGGVRGVATQDGRKYSAPAVVLTAGTFLRGVIHQGLDIRVPAGRAGDAPAVELAQVIEELGVTVERFKTGTPPRIDGCSVDLTRLDRQDGDPGHYWFSFYERSNHPEQRPCYLTWTGRQLRDIITTQLSQSALYGGAIASRGPRYCPSIEDKIVKFPHAVRHQVFLEPEGLDTSEMYVNGLSTSLPPEVQLQFLQSIPGLESVRMTRPGYAIEYDYFPPTQLSPSLELRVLPGLFLAGQVNGTTGYEEAAGQGALAGINAAALALDRESVVLRRDEAFIGVLVDDLVSRGVDEPYRLFTSRSEYRLLLRQDNALRRLLPLAERLGLLDDQERRMAESRLAREDELRQKVEEVSLDATSANVVLTAHGSTPVVETRRVAELACRPGVPTTALLRAGGVEASEEDCQWTDIELKYAGYLAREQSTARRLAELNDFALPDALAYRSLLTLSYEAREKLHAVRPPSLGHASRIPGVSPSDLHNLVVEVLRARRQSEEPACFT